MGALTYGRIACRGSRDDSRLTLRVIRILSILIESQFAGYGVASQPESEDVKRIEGRRAGGNMTTKEPQESEQERTRRLKARVVLECR